MKSKLKLTESSGLTPTSQILSESALYFSLPYRQTFFDHDPIVGGAVVTLVN